MPLEQLPKEILELIASFTPVWDLPALRLVSWTIYQKTQDACIKRIFRNLRTDLSKADLDLMVDLGKNAELAQRVKKMTIIPRYGDENGYKNVGKGFFWPREEPAGNLDASLLGLDKLLSVLKWSLPNCCEFDVKAVGHPTGELLTMDFIFLLERLLSTARLHCVKPSADFVEDTYTAPEDRLPIGILNRPLQKGALEAWSSVKQLSLHNIPAWLIEKGWLAAFLSLTSGLRSLSLSGDLHGSWACGFRGNISCSRLTSLSVQWMMLDSRALSVISSFCSLKSLTMDHVVVRTGSNPWLTFLKGLPVNAPGLKSFCFQYIVIEDGGSRFMKFSNIPGLKDNPAWTIYFSGSDESSDDRAENADNRHDLTMLYDDTIPSNIFDDTWNNTTNGTNDQVPDANWDNAPTGNASEIAFGASDEDLDSLGDDWDDTNGELDADWDEVPSDVAVDDREVESSTTYHHVEIKWAWLSNGLSCYLGSLLVSTGSYVVYGVRYSGDRAGDMLEVILNHVQFGKTKGEQVSEG